ncbi:hypothetical protein [Kribbella italica]|uniref:Uncharacterized protein n=1 Tax=Kribbella italica TaxID=1540520 RepID=A0A7W9MTV9_9ACTN|nr:hypothetical protein [Kribbella italica]MBB5836099.1 hypothetical protein [Kribbella italica]
MKLMQGLLAAGMVAGSALTPVSAGASTPAERGSVPATAAGGGSTIGTDWEVIVSRDDGVALEVKGGTKFQMWCWYDGFTMPPLHGRYFHGKIPSGRFDGSMVNVWGNDVRNQKSVPHC